MATASKAYLRAWRKANKTRIAKHARHQLLKKYGLTFADYTALLAHQKGGCAICGRKRLDATGRRLAIDHCHRTSVVRGLLCSRCNRALGWFENFSTQILRHLQQAY